MECKLSNDERARMKKNQKRHFYALLRFSALLFCTAHPCEVYADVSPCLHQAKSEMQVEFYVSDIQEVRDRFAPWSQLRDLPSHSDTWMQPDHMSHRDPFCQSQSLFQSFAFILSLISPFLKCNHCDTCLTQRSLAAETYLRPTYSPLRLIHHALLLFSFTLSLGLVWLMHKFSDSSSLTSNMCGRKLWSSFTKVFPPSGGQRHSKHPDWRRQW